MAPRLKKILQLATTAAAPGLVTPDRLLLATLEEGEGVACDILARLDVDLDELTAALRTNLRHVD